MPFIASPMSCLASNQPFVTQGAKVIWADIDPSTGTLMPDSVLSKITTKIIDGRDPMNVLRAIKGDDIGTTIVP